MSRADPKKNQDLIQRCNKHASFRHDFFISYRVAADKVNAEKLASMIDGSTNVETDAAFRCYLDRNCLIPGQSWKVGFLNGLKNSKTILIMISDGTISTLKAKAEAGDDDNVLTEHKEALRLRKAKGVVVIPVYVAHASKASNRDSYVLLDRENALRMFEDKTRGPAVTNRLQEVRQVLSEIFDLPGVDIEPDSIAEKIPKILEIFYHEHWSSGLLEHLWRNFNYAVFRFIRYPTDTFRLQIAGALFGIIPLFSLMLVFMPSKSKAHAALKRGVCVGNIVALFAVIVACAIMMYSYNVAANGPWCLDCEAYVTASGDALLDTIETTIPDFDDYLSMCVSENNCNDFGADTAICTQCICLLVYNACARGAGLYNLLSVILGVCSGFIAVALVMIQFLKSIERQSLALQ